MTPEFAYLLKVNVAFVLFYAFYRLFFYKDTFFKLRRAILLAFFGLALFYPLLNIQDWVRQQEPIADVIYMYSAMLPEATAKADAADVGAYLFSRAASSQVSSAQVGLTAVFGMGTGVPPPPSTPTMGAPLARCSVWVSFWRLAPPVGLEPTTFRLTAERSTD